MAFELVTAIREVLSSLSTIAESVEKSIESIKRSVGSISAGLENRNLRKIADALANFYFTPVGIRMDIEEYIKNPSHDTLHSLLERLEQNQELTENFGRFVYSDMDRTLFDLPLSNIDYLFGAKSRLHTSIYSAQWELERMTPSEKQDYLNETKQSFDEFNRKLEETIRYIKDAID